MREQPWLIIPFSIGLLAFLLLVYVLSTITYLWWKGEL